MKRCPRVFPSLILGYTRHGYIYYKKKSFVDVVNIIVKKSNRMILMVAGGLSEKIGIFKVRSQSIKKDFRHKNTQKSC